MSDVATQIRLLMLGLAPRGPVQPAWVDSIIDLLPKAADKIERQQSALQTAKSYIDAQPLDETTANILAIVNGVLDSDEYVP